jgi:hypothetical protein
MPPKTSKVALLKKALPKTSKETANLAEDTSDDHVPHDTTNKKPDKESTITYLYNMISNPQLRAVGADFIEKLIYLYFLYLFQKGVGATFNAFDSMLLGAFNNITGHAPDDNEERLDLTRVRYANEEAEAPQRRLSAEELREIVELTNEAHRIAMQQQAPHEITSTSRRTPLLMIMPEEEEENAGALSRGSTRGSTPPYAMGGSIGKNALKALLLTALTTAVGAYAIKSVEDDKNLNYDAERRDPYTIPPKKAPYDIDVNTKNWVNRYKEDAQKELELGGRFSKLEKLAAKKTTKKKPIIKNSGSDAYAEAFRKGFTQSDPYAMGATPTQLHSESEFSSEEKLIEASEEFKDDIQYAKDNNLSGNALKVFVSICLLAGVAWGMHGDGVDTFVLDRGQILYDSINNVSLSGVTDYVNSMFPLTTTHLGRNRTSDYERGLYYNDEEEAPYYPGFRSSAPMRADGLKKTIGGKTKSKKVSEAMGNAPEPISETFYQKRIKPVVNKIYNVLTSDESITVAKTVAQLAFLTAVMYGIREAGSAMLSPSADMIVTAIEDINRRARTARAIQDLEQLRSDTLSRTGMTLEEQDAERVKESEEFKNMNEEDLPWWQWHLRDRHDYEPNQDYKPNLQLSPNSSPMRDIRDVDKYRLSRYAGEHYDEDISPQEYNKQVKMVNKIFPTLEGYKNLSRKQRANLIRDYDSENEETKTGRGLYAGNHLSNNTIAKLKKVAKKIYDNIKSKKGQMAVKGLTVAAITAGLIKLMHSRMRSPPENSPTLTPSDAYAVAADNNYNLLYYGMPDK